MASSATSSALVLIRPQSKTLGAISSNFFGCLQRNLTVLSNPTSSDVELRKVSLFVMSATTLVLNMQQEMIKNLVGGKPIIGVSEKLFLSFSTDYQKETSGDLTMAVGERERVKADAEYSLSHLNLVFEGLLTVILECATLGISNPQKAIARVSHHHYRTSRARKGKPTPKSAKYTPEQIAHHKAGIACVAAKCKTLKGTFCPYGHDELEEADATALLQKIMPKLRLVD